MENLDAAAYRACHGRALQGQLAYIWEHSSFYQDKFRQARAGLEM